MIMVFWSKESGSVLKIKEGRDINQGLTMSYGGENE